MVYCEWDYMMGDRYSYWDGNWKKRGFVRWIPSPKKASALVELNRGRPSGLFYTGGLSRFLDDGCQGRRFKVTPKKIGSLYELVLRELARVLKTLQQGERQQLAEYLVKLDAIMHSTKYAVKDEGREGPKGVKREVFSELALKTYESLPPSEIRKRDLVSCLVHHPGAQCLVCCESGVYSLSPVEGSFENKSLFCHKVGKSGTFVSV